MKMDAEVLKVVREKGLLLEREVFDLLESFQDSKVAGRFLEQVSRVAGSRMITRKVLGNNVEYVQGFLSGLTSGREDVEKVFVKFGLSLEIRREMPSVVSSSTPEVRKDYKVVLAETGNENKIEVKDFVGHFRSRFQQIQRILMARSELQSNLVSINKISSERTSLSIIGIVTEKRATKNGNLIISLEDLTGKINVLVKKDREEIFPKADELQLDEIVGVKASGNRDILFVHDIIFPDCFVQEKVRFNENVCAAFLSDIHCGNVKHLGENFEKFLDWIGSDDPLAAKIKYLFFVGDNVDGVGIYPGQENDLILKSSKEQYDLLVSYLKRIPSRITMFMCPGQHDAVRVMEPQPVIGEKYAPGLKELDNLVLVTNPAMIKLLEGEKEFKVLMYHGASLHVFINEIKELREMNAHTCPAKAVKHMLKRRHLAPMHGQSTAVVYVPNSDNDPLVISEVPDVMTTGDLHRSDVETHNGVLIITNSCWQSQTPFEEKVGNIPDLCKVPILNLKTRELKVLDFSEGAEE